MLFVGCFRGLEGWPPRRTPRDRGTLIGKSVAQPGLDIPIIAVAANKQIKLRAALDSVHRTADDQPSADQSGDQS